MPSYEGVSMGKRKKSILITGVRGFVGTALKEHINACFPAWRVYGMDRLGGREKDFFQNDFSDSKKTARVLANTRPDYIFHLAGMARGDDPRALLAANVDSLIVLCEAISRIKAYAPRVLVPGSAAEYGDLALARLPAREVYPAAPIAYYGWSKAIATETALFYARRGLDLVVARIFNICGAGTPESLSVGRLARDLALIKQKKQKPVLTVYGLDSRRDFLDIADVCAYLTDLALKGASGQIYNICRGRSHTIREVMAELIKISGIKGLVIDRSAARGCSVGVADSFGSNKKLQKISSLRPAALRAGLRDTYMYYLSKV